MSRHTNKGEMMAVAPIREPKDVVRIRKMLQARGELRNALLFCIGCNNGLRAIDLLNLKVGDVRYLNIGEARQIKEQKTGKTNVMMLNKICKKLLDEYLAANPDLKDSDFLFPSKKGSKLDTKSLNKLVKKWVAEIGLTGDRYGCHTMRKTFGFIQRTRYGVGFEVLAKRFAHSSPAITMKYLGIQDREVTEILMHEI